MIITEKAGETRYLLSDGLGSVRQATDDTGSVVVYNEFDPYGNPIVNRKSEIANPYGYTGEWWQDEVELLHLRARWYMPGTGTFLSRDAWEGDPRRSLTLDSWSHVEDNPINYTDPTGECSVDAPDAKPVSPTSTQAQKLIPSLNRIWHIKKSSDYKPECCVKINPCQDCCVNQARKGVIIRPDDKTFTTADDYMRYWLAWEKANPCCYRAKANCMGAALEVSKLYKGWSSPALVDGDYTAGDYETTGFMQPEFWPKWVKKGYFIGEWVIHSNDPGDIITYTPNRGSEKGYPAHLMVITDHNGMCFEKQSPQLPRAYYQLRTCDRDGVYTWGIYNVDYYHPKP